MKDLMHTFAKINFLNVNEKYLLYQNCNMVYELFAANAKKLKELSEYTNISFNKLKCFLNIKIEKFNPSNSLINIVDIYSKDYPPLLKHIYGAPLVIYYMGNLPNIKNISLVGSRKCSDYGAKMAVLLSDSLSKEKYEIVSGMARGIDAICHSAALNNFSSTAVLGCGLDVCYPKDNINVYKRLIKQGCIISEFPPGTPPLAQNFPQRNRIVSGLSFCTVIIQSSKKSGSLITANSALSQNREVYCFPDRIDSIFNGNNDLIKEGAGIITDIQSFIQEIKEVENHWKNIYHC